MHWADSLALRGDISGHDASVPASPCQLR